MIVVDTNVIAGLVLIGPTTTTIERLHALDADWAAPPIWRSELRNVLVRHCRAGMTSWTDAPELMALAEAEMIGREHTVESMEVLRFARATGCTAYDAEFGALAEGLDLPLVTWDNQLLAALPGRALTPEDYVDRC